jgi:hypothetical protein
MADTLDLQEIGTTGLRRYGGIVNEEILPSLQSVKGRTVLREMSENDPVIGAILFAIEKVITRLEWRIDPAGDSPEDDQAAEFIQSCLDDMSDSWDSTLTSILSMLVFGWSYHEVVYKRRGGPTATDPTRKSKYSDNKIGWRKWSIRAQETLYAWQFDTNGGIQGMYQVDPYNAKTGVLIPIEKALLFRTTTQKGNPEGRSLLRNAYRPWFFKRRIEEIEAVGIERDLAGLPVAYVPPEYLAANATPEQVSVLSAIQSIVTSIKRNEQEGIVFPTVYDEQGHKLFDLILLSAGGQRQFDTDKVITRYDQRMAMSVESDFLLLGHDRVGSFALGASKMDLWSMVVDAIAKSIAEVVNTHAIPRLLTINGMNPENPPYLTYGEVAHVDLSEISDFVQKLTAAGAIMPDESLEEYLRGVAGLPPADKVRTAPMPAPTKIPQNSPQQPQGATNGEDATTAPSPAQSLADEAPPLPNAKG